MFTEKGKVYGTGLTGTIGRFLPKSYIDLNIRLESDFNLNHVDTLEDSSIIHLGARVGSSLVEGDLSYSHLVNVDGSIRLGSEALERNVRKFLYISSSHVYEPTSIRIDESMPTKPWSNYGLQKLQAENALRNIFRNFPEKLLILRVFSLLDWEMPYGTLGYLIEKIAIGKSNGIVNFSDDIRDFLAPYQVANLISKIVGTSEYGTYNICSGEGRSIHDAAIRMMSSASEYSFELRKRLIKGNSAVPNIVGNNSNFQKVFSLTIPSWSPSKIPHQP